MNHDELRAQLDAAVPEPPDPSGWADEARRRQARKTRSVMASGVAIVVLAVVGALLWPAWNGAGRLAVPATSPTLTVTEPAPANPDCAGVRTGTSTLAPRGSTAVARASLCPRAAGDTFTTPADALDEGATALFDAVAALPAERSRGSACDAASDRRYLLVFTLADGSRRVLEAVAPNACGVTPASANGRRWSGLLSALEQAWTAQRDRRPQPAAVAGCVSAERPGLFRFEAGQIRAGDLCTTDRAGTPTGSSAGLSRQDLALLRDDLASNVTYGIARDSFPDGAVLTVAGPWNDPLVFWRTDGNTWFARVPDAKGTQLAWQPGPAATAALEAVLDHLKPYPSPSASMSLVPELCQGLTPSSSPAQVPTRADRLRLCPTAHSAPTMFTPLDAVTGADTAAVLATLRGLPSASKNQACTEEMGPDFLLVAEFDHQPPVVMVLQLYGCRLAGIAGAARGGADRVLTSFTEQLGRQRQLLDRPAARSGPLCGALETVPFSVMPMSVAEATGAQLCSYGAGSAPVRTLALPDADVRAIVADIPRHSGPFSPRACPYQPNSHSLRIALTSFYGDVLVLAQSCGGVFVFAPDTHDNDKQWQPSAAIAKRLAKLADR